MNSEWKGLFEKIELSPYWKDLMAFLDSEYGSKTVYPPRSEMFRAFDLTSPDKVKAVIVGQDPYHELGQAMGLCFSVPNGIPLPPSLKNIYRELENDLGQEVNYERGDLSEWARQGVLLLNAYLSVEAGKPLSHKRKEYDLLLLDVIAYLETLDQPIAYLLWGGFARKLEKRVVNPNHAVLLANHPSPLSANRGGWFGSKPFSSCNAFLEEQGCEPIDWIKGREGQIRLF